MGIDAISYLETSNFLQEIFHFLQNTPLPDYPLLQDTLNNRFLPTLPDETYQGSLFWVPTENGALFLGLKSHVSSSHNWSNVFCSQNTKLFEEKRNFSYFIQTANLVSYEQDTLNVREFKKIDSDSTRVLVIENNLSLEETKNLYEELNQDKILLHINYTKNSSDSVTDYLSFCDSLSVSLSTLFGQKGLGSCLLFPSHSQLDSFYAQKYRPFYGDSDPNPLIIASIIVAMKNSDVLTTSASPLSSSSQHDSLSSSSEPPLAQQNETEPQDLSNQQSNEEERKLKELEQKKK